MTAFVRFNALDQALDIAGSLLQSDTRTLQNEPDGYGSPIAGQTGSDGYVSVVGGGLGLDEATIIGLTGMSSLSVGRMLTLSSSTASNTGTFLIVAEVDATSVKVLNASAVVDTTNPSTWTERNPYSLEDDINFIRTDRRLIKGTDNFYSDIPTYTRPTNTTVEVPANLKNIASKTLDAHAWVYNRVYRYKAVTNGDGYVTLTDAPGTFPFANATNNTGVPINDGWDAGKDSATYVELINPVTENYLVDKYTGERVFGRTRAGVTGVDGTSVEVEFRKVPFGSDVSTSTAYTWDGYQPEHIDLYYGYRDRLDTLDETAFRTILVNGLFADNVNGQNISNILTTIGTVIGDTYLTLNNTGDYYVFSDLPDATPSVTEVVQTINNQIGNRTFTGDILGNSDGYTITALLQELANAIAQANFVRVIERLNAAIPANTIHSLPGLYSYTLDPTNNGQNLVVYSRGLLRDPGPITGYNDYAEVSTTQIKFYSAINNHDHINYFIYS